MSRHKRKDMPQSRARIVRSLDCAFRALPRTTRPILSQRLHVRPPLAPRVMRSSSSCPNNCPSRPPLRCGSVESFLRGVELVHDQQRLPPISSKVTVVTAHRHRLRHWSRRGGSRCHFDVLAEEFHTVAEHQTVPASGTNIHLAGKSRDMPIDLGPPPPLEQFGLRPRSNTICAGAAKSSSNDQLTARTSAPQLCGSSRDWAHSLFLRPSNFFPLFQILDNPVQLVEACCQSWRYFSSHAVASSSRSGPSLQVRTRPTFSVDDEPGLLQDADVLLHAREGHFEFLARSVIEASPRASLLQYAGVE